MFQSDPIFAPTASGSSGDTTPDQGSGAGGVGGGGGAGGMGLADAALRPGNVCRCLSEFALEFRTTREKVLQQNIRKQASRERRKTRGKTILEARDYIYTCTSTYSTRTSTVHVCTSITVIIKMFIR